MPQVDGDDALVLFRRQRHALPSGDRFCAAPVQLAIARQFVPGGEQYLGVALQPSLPVRQRQTMKRVNGQFDLHVGPVGRHCAIGERVVIQFDFLELRQVEQCWRDSTGEPVSAEHDAFQHLGQFIWNGPGQLVVGDVQISEVGETPNRRWEWATEPVAVQRQSLELVKPTEGGGYPARQAPIPQKHARHARWGAVHLDALPVLNGQCPAPVQSSAERPPDVQQQLAVGRKRWVVSCAGWWLAGRTGVSANGRESRHRRATASGAAAIGAAWLPEEP